MRPEPRYVRYLRRIMDVLTPSGIDGFLLGFVVSTGTAIVLYLWWSGQ